MPGTHNGILIDYGNGRYAQAVVEVDGTGGVHVGPNILLSGGRVAVAVVERSKGSGTFSGVLTDLSNSGGVDLISTSVSLVDGTGGTHTGALIDLGNGRYARPIVIVSDEGGVQSGNVVALSNNRSALAVTAFDINGSEDPIGGVTPPGSAELDFSQASNSMYVPLVF